MFSKISHNNFKFLSLIGLLSLGLLCNNLEIYSQGQAVRNVIAPSPNATSLGRYGDIPVNLYAGQEQITIPLYTVADNNINLPIFLSYHGGGIKVEEVESWVGLGWALNAGGVITRTVRGLPDENTGFHNYEVDDESVDPND
jgi:hypothetical protein